MLQKLKKWFCRPKEAKEAEELYFKAVFLLKAEISRLKDQNARLEAENGKKEDWVAMLKSEKLRAQQAVEKVEKRLFDAKSRLDLFENESQVRAREMFDTQFIEIAGESPILWITAPKFMLDSGTFANLHDKMKRVCPKIKLLLFTSNECHLTELTDVELNRMGLARIMPNLDNRLESPAKAIEDAK